MCWLVVWVDWLIGLFVGSLICWLVGRLVGCLFTLLILLNGIFVVWLIGLLFGLLVELSICCLVYNVFSLLTGCVVEFFVGWFVC